MSNELELDGERGIMRPLLASYRAELPEGGFPKLTLSFVREGGDPLYGPHDELSISIDPVQARQTARDLDRLTDEFREGLDRRLAKARRR